MSALFILYGNEENVYQDRIGENFVPHPTRTPVAKFTSKHLAEDYVKKSRLKKPRRGWCCEYPFKQISLLGHCNGYEIEGEDPIEIPVDPTL